MELTTFLLSVGIIAVLYAGYSSVKAFEQN